MKSIDDHTRQNPYDRGDMTDDNDHDYWGEIKSTLLPNKKLIDPNAEGQEGAEGADGSEAADAEDDAYDGEGVPAILQRCKMAPRCR